MQALLILLCLIPIGRLAAGDWGAVRLALGQMQAPAVLASALAQFLASFALPVAMAAFTRGAAGRIGYRASALAYFGSQPMKYLPGSFWILPGRVILLRSLGHDVGLASAGLLFEMVAQVLSCALVVVALNALIGFATGWYGAAAWAILAGALIAGLLLLFGPALAGRIRRPAAVRRALAQLAAVPLAARLRGLLVTALCYGVMWLLMGVSFYALLTAAAPRMDLALLALAVGVSSLSWLAGFLTPFSPGGVGVREGVIALLLTPAVGGPQAVTVALLSRVLALAVELAFFAGVWRPLHRG